MSFALVFKEQADDYPDFGDRPGPTVSACLEEAAPFLGVLDVQVSVTTSVEGHIILEWNRGSIYYSAEITPERQLCLGVMTARLGPTKMLMCLSTWVSWKRSPKAGSCRPPGTRWTRHGWRGRGMSPRQASPDVVVIHPICPFCDERLRGVGADGLWCRRCEATWTPDGAFDEWDHPDAEQCTSTQTTPVHLVRPDKPDERRCLLRVGHKSPVHTDGLSVGWTDTGEPVSSLLEHVMRRQTAAQGSAKTAGDGSDR